MLAVRMERHLRKGAIKLCYNKVSSQSTVTDDCCLVTRMARHIQCWSVDQELWLD